MTQPVERLFGEPQSAIVRGHCPGCDKPYSGLEGTVLRCQCGHSVAVLATAPVTTPATDPYARFLDSKRTVAQTTGLQVDARDLSKALFPFQRVLVRWALARGRAAIFADCGMGKTIMQLEWAHRVPGRVLILAPLAVSSQTVEEGERFDLPVEYARAEGRAKVTITNYEMLDHFEPDSYSGIVLDESSILKNYAGKFRNRIIESFEGTPYRLACTATPAPNDYMELGNHAEFLGIMTRVEMLSMFFVHDGGETQKWRLKGHAEAEFWRWLCSWAVMIRKPSDIGHEDGAFILPPITYEQVTVEDKGPRETLFAVEAQTLIGRLAARRDTIKQRAKACASLVNGNEEPWIVWCNLNAEADTVARLIPGAVNVQGSDTLEKKEARLRAFSHSEFRVLITKPSICGHGMNWQHCRNVAFLGLSDSWEAYYQAVRRSWRFGQTQPVDVYSITADTEGAVVKNIKRKEREAAKMAENMVEHMTHLTKKELKGTARKAVTYATDATEGGAWTAILGDCVEVSRELEDESIGYSIFSPPFASLYTYSASERDMGNCSSYAGFFAHLQYLITELFRVTMPGRLASFHCMNIPTSKTQHGYIGLQDFRGELTRAFIDAGWIFHSEVCIWKDPVTAMQRTKALGLLHKQIKKDSCMSRQGLPDYLITMRKPGENPQPVSGDLMEKYAAADIDGHEIVKRLNAMHGTASREPSIDMWQLYASPVWTDIRPSNTLQKASAREEKDERHICPLQLEVIERALILWSNAGDLVFSPFMGIGSEGVVSLRMRRRFIGIELKRSYWDQSVANLTHEESAPKQGSLL